MLDWNRRKEDVIGYILETGHLKMVDLSQQKITTLTDPSNALGKNKYPVCCFKWHPTKANILAFGTTEGRVAFMDVDTLTVTPVKVKESCSVEDLEWFQGEDYVLAAFNDGSMRIYDFANPNIAQVFFTPHT